MNNFVSIVIPCRNEEKFIGKCLESLVSQDYLRLRQGLGGQAKEKMEILVVDGMSSDKTREIVQKYRQKVPYIKLLDNPQKFTPFALNIGIKNCSGEIVMFIGAHAVYENDYVSKCVKYLLEYNADNVGGILETLPKENTLEARAIAFCLSDFFGAGSSYFRISSSKPRWVDTIFGGCVKKEVFQKIGFFNEKLIRSQDIEFNKRLRESGGKILLVPDIKIGYFPTTDIFAFLKHNFYDGVWATYPLKMGIKIFSKRHLIPLVFVLAFFTTLCFSWFFYPAKLLFDLIFGSYFILSFCFSMKIALKNGFNFLFLMPVVFAVRHFGYGLGSLWGFLKPLKK